MKLDILLKMILILPKERKLSLTSSEIRDKYFKLNNEKVPSSHAARNMFIRRQIDEMIDLKMITEVLSGENNSSIKRSDTYYLNDSALLHHFMNSKVALNVLLANGVMNSLGPIFDLEDVKSTANAVRMNEKEKVLTQKIRMIPDGIGRKYANIRPTVFKTVIDALVSNHSLMLDYDTRQENIRINEISKNLERTLLGLVAKDGTIYAITCKSFDDIPLHIPLHRIIRAQETGTRAYARPDFNLDGYIEKQHQLAHVLHEYPDPIEMVLKVAKGSIFHFKERPINSIFSSQIVEEPTEEDGRYTVTVTVPFTVQLPPFLWSHAGWIEVISPPSLRKYVGERILAAAALYQNDIEPRFD